VVSSPLGRLPEESSRRRSEIRLPQMVRNRRTMSPDPPGGNTSPWLAKDATCVILRPARGNTRWLKLMTLARMLPEWSFCPMRNHLRMGETH
jgi:hypothetical protein